MYDNPSTTSVNCTNQPGFMYEIATTYKLDTVHFEAFHALEILSDTPLICPLGHQAQSVFADRRTDERENVLVFEMSPCHGVFAEPLRLVVSTRIINKEHEKRHSR